MGAKITTEEHNGVTFTKVEGSIFYALEDDPEVALSLTIRSELMISIKRWIRDHDYTQAEAADVLGVTQPRISNLMRGKIEAFTIDALVKMAARAGLDVRVTAMAA